jgi:hypothetical protein
MWVETRSLIASEKLAAIDPKGFNSSAAGPQPRVRNCSAFVDAGVASVIGSKILTCVPSIRYVS